MDEKKSRQYFLDQHRREVIWQIWIPVIIGVMIMLALGLLSALSLQTGTDASVRWGHVAAIWLILPFFVIGTLLLLLLIGLILGVTKITETLPDYASIVQMYARILAQKTLVLANRSTRPVIIIHSVRASKKRFWLTLRILFLG